MTGKEGTDIAKYFARKIGLLAVVVHYRLGVFPKFGLRAGSMEKSLEDAVASLKWVRSQGKGHKQFKNKIDLERIILIGKNNHFRNVIWNLGYLGHSGHLGFSAGGHLALCLQDADKNDKTKSVVDIAGMILVYPTLRYSMNYFHFRVR